MVCLTSIRTARANPASRPIVYHAHRPPDTSNAYSHPFRRCWPHMDIPVRVQRSTIFVALNMLGSDRMVTALYMTSSTTLVFSQIHGVCRLRRRGSIRSRMPSYFLDTLATLIRHTKSRLSGVMASQLHNWLPFTTLASSNLHIQTRYDDTDTHSARAAAKGLTFRSESSIFALNPERLPNLVRRLRPPQR